MASEPYKAFLMEPSWRQPLSLTRRLAVKDLRGVEAAARFLGDVGVIQLGEATGGGQEEVPQPRLSSLALRRRESSLDLTFKLWGNLDCAQTKVKKITKIIEHLAQMLHAQKTMVQFKFGPN